MPEIMELVSRDYDEVILQICSRIWRKEWTIVRGETEDVKKLMQLLKIKNNISEI